MHDANGTPLRKGDRVLIPGIITELSVSDEYCNVNVETELGRRPDGVKETFHAINTAQLIKFRNTEPEPPKTDVTYFDPKTGMRPEDLHAEPESLAVTV